MMPDPAARSNQLMCDGLPFRAALRRRLYRHATAKMGFLNRESLDDALMGRRRVDTSEREAGLREYPGKFVLTALDTAGDRKHEKIHELAVMGHIAVG
jgi:hypothetical protein